MAGDHEDHRLVSHRLTGDGMTILRRLRELALRVRGAVIRPDAGGELREELETHLAMATAEYIGRGISPDEARRLASIDAAGVEVAVEAYRDQQRLPALDRFWQDVRFGVRMLRRNPSFTAISVGAIALALGVNAGAFTLVDTMMWRPMPVANPSRFVRLLVVYARGFQNIRFSYTDFRNIAAHSHTVQDVVAYDAAPVALRVGSGSARATTASVGCVSGNYFTSLGGKAVTGRVLAPADDREGAEAVVVISEDFRRRALSEVPDVVGHLLFVNGAPVKIVGVVQERFVGVNPLVPDLWMPLTAADRVGATPGRLLDPKNRFVVVRGRLAPGVTMQQAAGELSGLVAEPATGLAGSDAALSRVVGAALLPNDTFMPLTTETGAIMFPGLAIVGLILVIACANLANLLLSRALARQREIAVRLALGASRGRIIRQLLTESLLIALLGAALGAVVANWTVMVASRSFFETVPRTLGHVMLELHASWRVVAYTVLLAGVSVLTFGLAPALQSTSAELSPTLKGDDAAFGSRIRRSRFRNGLVAAQVGACLVLLVAAGTFVQSLRNWATHRAELDTRSVIMAQVGLAGAERVPPSLASVRTTFAARVASAPNVRATARVAVIPFGGWPSLRATAADGDAIARPFYSNVVTTRYFDIVGQRLVMGRVFAPSDSVANAPVAIITQAAARTLWPRSVAVGKTLRVLSRNDSTDHRYLVVGVVADAHSEMVWDDDSNGYVFLLATSGDLARGEMSLLLRHSGDSADVSRQLDDIAAQVAPDAPLSTGALSAQFELQLLPFQYSAVIASGIGVLGLALAMMGLYGVVSFAVAQRRRELAVHVAMGASARDVLRLVLEREMRLVFLGLGGGLVLALLEAKLLGSIVIPLTSLPVVAFAGLVVLLLAVSVAAIVVPGLSALRIAPMDVLRHE
jgi:putative ABC transport system permease protein